MFLYENQVAYNNWDKISSQLDIDNYRDCVTKIVPHLWLKDKAEQAHKDVGEHQGKALVINLFVVIKGILKRLCFLNEQHVADAANNKDKHLKVGRVSRGDGHGSE